MKDFNTFAEMEASVAVKTGQRFVCRERADAEYILQASSYSALPGDVTFSNGRVAALVVPQPANVNLFGVLPNETLDQSSGIQDAIDRVASLGIGVNNSSILYFPAGRYLAKELSIPDRVTIQGSGITATEIRLPNGANTFLMADAKYISNSPFVAERIEIKDIGLDGNKDNQTESHPIFILKGYRCSFESVYFSDSSSHACLYTELSANGTPTTGGLAENTWFKCHFDRNNGAGIFGEIGGTNQLADGVISECIFNGNCLTTKFGDIYLERSAGFKILNNQLYLSGYHNIYCASFSRGVISGNHCDVHGTSAEAGDDPSCIKIPTFSANGASVINNNPLFVNHSGAASPVALNLGGTTESLSVIGNSVAQAGSSPNGVVYSLGNLPNAIFNNSYDDSIAIGDEPLANKEERTFKGDIGDVILNDGYYTTATTAIFYVSIDYEKVPTAVTSDTNGDTFPNAFVIKDKASGATYGNPSGVSILATQTSRKSISLLFSGLPAGTVGTPLRLEALLNDVGFTFT